MRGDVPQSGRLGFNFRSCRDALVRRDCGLPPGLLPLSAPSLGWRLRRRAAPPCLWLALAQSQPLSLSYLPPMLTPSLSSFFYSSPSPTCSLSPLPSPHSPNSRVTKESKSFSATFSYFYKSRRPISSS